jgi:hypothetical protein
MSFLFSKSASNFQEYTETGWLYFFLTHPQSTEKQAFVKFGMTKRILSKRLRQYLPLDISNIYAIQLPQSELGTRETAMRYIFKVCKETTLVDIQSHSGHEYLKGDLNLMLKVFFHFCTMPIDRAYMYYYKKIIVDKYKILDWLDDLHPIETYKIQVLTPNKINLMNPDISNIRDIKDNNSNKEETEKESLLSDDREEENTSEDDQEEHKCNQLESPYKGNEGNNILLSHYSKLKTENTLNTDFLVEENKRLNNQLEYLYASQNRYNDRIKYLQETIDFQNKEILKYIQMYEEEKQDRKIIYTDYIKLVKKLNGLD